MPVDVKCPGCFSTFAVSSKYAGRSIRCKTCRTAVKVPPPERSGETVWDAMELDDDSEPEPPRLPPRTVQPQAARKKRRAPTSRAKREVQILGSILLVLFLASLFSTTMKTVFVCSGCFVALVSCLYAVITLWRIAFGENLVHGIVSLCTPYLYVLYLAITDWPTARKPIGYYAAGVALFVATSCLVHLTSSEAQLREMGLIKEPAGNEPAHDARPPAVARDVAIANRLREPEKPFTRPAVVEPLEFVTRRSSRGARDSMPPQTLSGQAGALDSPTLSGPTTPIENPAANTGEASALPSRPIATASPGAAEGPSGTGYVRSSRAATLSEAEAAASSRRLARYPAPAGTRAIDSIDELRAGMRVIGLFVGGWEAAEVLEIQGGDRVKVHRPRLPEAFDRVQALAELRIPLTEAEIEGDLVTTLTFEILRVGERGSPSVAAVEKELLDLEGYLAGTLKLGTDSSSATLKSVRGSRAEREALVAFARANVSVRPDQKPSRGRRPPLSDTDSPPAAGELAGGQVMTLRFELLRSAGDGQPDAAAVEKELLQLEGYVARTLKFDANTRAATVQVVQGTRAEQEAIVASKGRKCLCARLQLRRPPVPRLLGKAVADRVRCKPLLNRGSCSSRNSGEFRYGACSVVHKIAQSLVFGAGLLALGAGLMYWHLRVWRAHRADSTLDEFERRHYRAQVRRRVQVAILLIVLGLMIPIGDALMTFNRQQGPALFAMYWGAVLLITLWVMVLAAFDWVASRANQRSNQAALAALARKRQELEAEVARLRAHGRNGSG